MTNPSSLADSANAAARDATIRDGDTDAIDRDVEQSAALADGYADLEQPPEVTVEVLPAVDRQ